LELTVLARVFVTVSTLYFLNDVLIYIVESWYYLSLI